MWTEAFINEQSLALLRWAYNKTGDSRQAEELTQEVWVRVLTALQRGGEPIRDQERYLWKVAKYVWYRRLREKTRVLGWVSTDEIELPDGEDFAERLAQDDETRRQLDWLRRRVVRLNRREREILLLRYLDGLSVREIARRLNLSEATVKWHLHDTREKLKEESHTMNEQEFLYRPGKLHLGINGQPVQVMDIELIKSDPVRQNLCLACYRGPKTLAQLTAYLGIPAGYLEPALRWLVEKEFMAETPQGFLTTFLITSEKEQQEHYAAHKRHRAEVADVAVDGLLRAEETIRAIGFHGSDQPMNKLLWLLIYRLCSQCEAPVQPTEPPIRPDGGRYWPLGFDRTETDLEYEVDDRGWAYNGAMNFGTFHWFGLYNFGNTEIENLLESYTTYWWNLKETLLTVIDRGGDIAGLLERQREDLAELVRKGFLTMRDGRAEANFCVFTQEQWARMESEVLAPVRERMKPGLAALTEDLREVVKKQLPRQLRDQTEHAVSQAVFDLSYLTYIFAFNDGKLYVPPTKEDGMFLTLGCVR